MAEPSIARLGHVGLHVQDLEKAKPFYRDILGLTVTDEDPETTAAGAELAIVTAGSS
jgi:catechol-2,3-dioxygenase